MGAVCINMRLGGAVCINMRDFVLREWIVIKTTKDPYSKRSRANSWEVSSCIELPACVTYLQIFAGYAVPFRLAASSASKIFKNLSNFYHATAVIVGIRFV